MTATGAWLRHSANGRLCDNVGRARAEIPRSVGSIVRQFGSHSFTIPASDGTPVPVSLEHLRNHDPETTLAVVSVRVEAENDQEAADLIAAIESMPE